MNQPKHEPVLLPEVIAILAPRPGEVVIDATVGLGGHANAFLEAIGPDGRLIGIDADNENLATAGERLSLWGRRVMLHHGNFSGIASMNISPADIIFADLGLSSPHVDDPERGFTFRAEAPLDMRFDRTKGRTARQIIAEADSEELAQIFRSYGELYREARRLSVLLAGTDVPTTTALRERIEMVFGFRAKALLPRVFQAIRIAVNDELGALERFLADAPLLLKPGGRLGIISFHSLEDRMVKQAFRAMTAPKKDPVTGAKIAEAAYAPRTKKPVVPAPEEQERNPRARSAKFRALQRR